MDKLTILIILCVGMILGILVYLPFTYEKQHLQPLLIKEQCAYYDINTGEFIIKNQTRKRK